MSAMGLSDDDDRKAFCRQQWNQIMLRNIPDQATMDMCVGIVHNSGSDALISFLTVSTEGKSVLNAKRKAAGLAPV